MNHQDDQDDQEPDYRAVPNLAEGERSLKRFIATAFSPAIAANTDTRAMLRTVAINFPHLPMSEATGRLIAGAIGIDQFEDALVEYRKK